MNIEEELNKIQSLNNFILEKIAEGEKISFKINEDTLSKGTDVTKKAINTIVNIYKKEYNEIMKVIQSFDLEQ